MEHHGTGCDPRAMTHLDIPEDFGSGADEHAVADLGMTVAALLAGAAERHVLEHRHVVLDHSGRADNETCCVVEEDAATDPGCRMNIGLEHFRRPALEIKREILPVPAPQPMREPMGLDGVEAFEIQQRLERPGAGGIAIHDRADVGAKSFTQRRIVHESLVKGLLDDVGGKRRVIETRGDPMSDRLVETRLVEHRAQGKACKRRFLGDQDFGLAPEPVPDRIEKADLFRGRRLETCLRHGWFSLRDRSGVSTSLRG